MEIIKMYLEKLKEKEPTLNERLYKNIYDEILCLSSLYSNNITKELEFKFKFSDIMDIINIEDKSLDLDLEYNLEIPNEVYLEKNEDNENYYNIIEDEKNDFLLQIYEFVYNKIKLHININKNKKNIDDIIYYLIYDKLLYLLYFLNLSHFQNIWHL